MQVHKGREQFWSLFFVGINIIATCVITLAMMEIGEDALRSPTDLASLLHCSYEGKTGFVRWWFHHLDRYQFSIGNTDRNPTDCNFEFTTKKIFLIGIL